MKAGIFCLQPGDAQNHSKIDLELAPEESFHERKDFYPQIVTFSPSCWNKIFLKMQFLKESKSKSGIFWMQWGRRQGSHAP